jgi:hypothetical protein
MFQFEYTDTFGGEANYSWVKREYVDLPPTATDRELVRAAKKWAGLTGMRCETDNFGETIAIRPRNMATVLFVTWEN